MAVFYSTRIRPSPTTEKEERTREFLSHYQATDELSKPPPAWTVLDAISVSNLHCHVDYFIKKFTSSILSVHPVSGTIDPDYSPPSMNEVCRIQRIFYRFELYCNLFREYNRRPRDKEHRFSAAEQERLFHRKFATWEIEQLACVRDYLMRQLSVAFDEVADHDVLWGELMINAELDSLGDNSWKEHYLSLGLGYIRKLDTASTYDERYALVAPNLGSDIDFLSTALREGDEIDDTIPFSDFDEEKQHRYLAKSPFTNDDGIGPIDAWYWGHNDESCARLYHVVDKAILRGWGYCLWDRTRLLAWDVLSKPWHSFPAFVEKRFSSDEYRRLREKQQRSWDERSRLYQLGSGWWAEGDESRIVWSCAKHLRNWRKS
ncbi:hypothetical protein MMC24_004024 [Lignoscripta atroalba]|nr:hypothetical protein [Lignoscripta atroalba]